MRSLFSPHRLCVMAEAHGQGQFIIFVTLGEVKRNWLREITLFSMVHFLIPITSHCTIIIVTVTNDYNISRRQHG